MYVNFTILYCSVYMFPSHMARMYREKKLWGEMRLDIYLEQVLELLWFLVPEIEEAVPRMVSVKAQPFTIRPNCASVTSDSCTVQDP